MLHYVIEKNPNRVVNVRCGRRFIVTKSADILPEYFNDQYKVGLISPRFYCFCRNLSRLGVLHVEKEGTFPSQAL